MCQQTNTQLVKLVYSQTEMVDEKVGINILNVFFYNQLSMS